MKEVPSFEVVYDLIAGRNVFWENAKAFLKIALKVAPGLLLGSFNIDLSNLCIRDRKIDVVKSIEKVQSVLDTMSQNPISDGPNFQKKYEVFRLANSWLILASYFDTIRRYHSKLWDAIDLQAGEVEWLNEELKESYASAQEIFGGDGRGILNLTENGLSLLEEYYGLLNKKTAHFAGGLKKSEYMSADWDQYPQLAVKCYKEEMTALCGLSQEFFAWTGLSAFVEILNSIDEIKEGQAELITLVKLLIRDAGNTVTDAAKEELVRKYPKNGAGKEEVLSNDEMKLVSDFSDKIDVENTAQILQYGVVIQKKIADLSDVAFTNVRTQDLGEVGDLIVNVIGELQDFDKEKKKGFLAFFRKRTDKLETMKAKFAKAEGNVAKIGEALEQHQMRLMKDSELLDQMYKQNLAYYKELTMYILAGKKKLVMVRAGKLAELQAKAQLSGLAEDAQAARDLSDKCDRFEKKIHDLELTRAISIQTAPQIRMIQNNDDVMVDKIRTTLENTIPLWKNQMVLALGIAHSSEAAAAQRQVTDITNALLKQNAERLHMASVETAKEAERGIVDIETLKATNAKLIQTFDDVMKIQSEGRAKRLAAEAEMVKMENDLKQKLLQIRNGG